MTTSEATTSQTTAAAVWRVLFDATAPLTTREVVHHTRMPQRAVLTVLIRLRSHPRISCVAVGTGSLWSVR